MQKKWNPKQYYAKKSAKAKSLAFNDQKQLKIFFEIVGENQIFLTMPYDVYIHPTINPIVKKTGAVWNADKKVHI